MKLVNVFNQGLNLNKFHRAYMKIKFYRKSFVVFWFYMVALYVSISVYYMYAWCLESPEEVIRSLKPGLPENRDLLYVSRIEPQSSGSVVSPPKH